MKALLEHEGKYIAEYAKPMGAFVLRFSGKRLAHVGKAVDAAIDRLIAGRDALTYRGFLTTGGTSKRYAAPKPVTGAGRTTLTKALSGLRAMPKERTMLYFKDGKPDALPPDRFAFHVSLVADHGNTFATGRGFLSCAFPLDTLEDPKWAALVDELVVLLGAEIAWMSPAIWLAAHCLFNGALNEVEKPAALIALFENDPQLDIPNLFASRWPFGFDELEPGPLEGFVAPAWVMWLDATLARRVKKYGGTTAKLHGGRVRYHVGGSPFAMTAKLYEQWKARWAELAAVHVRHTDENAISTYYCGRFAATSLDALGKDWRASHGEAAARQKRQYEISGEFQRLAAAPGPKLLEYADSVAKEMTSSNAWYFLPALRDLVEAGHAKPAEALVWLDICEQMNDPQLLRKLAAVAAVAGDHARAIDLLRRGLEANQIASIPELRRDPEFKALRKDPRFKKLVA